MTMKGNTGKNEVAKKDKNELKKIIDVKNRGRQNRNVVDRYL